ncbi:hypothetical protein PR001_g20272 [Phytophthora rubi]|uniref:Tf2-1-like SH3-like domain-containing protein n=1 Tax=Phytophthora rubi TaxID=129364 RepID=A0A6A3JIZ4_9STRA|nr:hypothetical protein PR001_g20272 [Phytophthora rubi]
MATFETGDQVLLSTDDIRSSAVTNLGASKLAPRFIGPFRVMKVNSEAYTLDISTSLRLHPTFYVGRFKKCDAATILSTATPPAPERRANAPRDSQRRDPGRYRDAPPLRLLIRRARRAGLWIASLITRIQLLRGAGFANLLEDPAQFQPRDDIEYVGSCSLLMNTWEPRAVLLRGVPDVVQDYESKIAQLDESAATRSRVSSFTKHSVIEPEFTGSSPGVVASMMTLTVEPSFNTKHVFHLQAGPDLTFQRLLSLVPPQVSLDAPMLLFAKSEIST